MESFNIVLIGSGGVGKSTSAIQFVNNVFVEEYDPTIEDVFRKLVTVDGNPCLLDIVDTVQPEECFAPKDYYYTHADGFIFLYSITSRYSFEELEYLREKVLRVKDTNTIPMIICGNKLDLEGQREVLPGEGEALAEKWEAPFFETSAKEGFGVAELFIQIIRELRQRVPRPVVAAAPQRWTCSLI